MRRFFSKQGWLLVLLALNGGCATRYVEPADPGAATVTSIPPAWLVSIDGRQVPLRFSRKARYRITPGEHLLMVRFVADDHNDVVTRSAGRMQPGGYAPGAVDPRNPQLTQTTTQQIQLRSEHDVPLTIHAIAGHNYYIKDGRTETSWDPYMMEEGEPTFLNLPYH